MSKEHIEEMAKIICKTSSSRGQCEKCGFFERRECYRFEQATDLYNAGYRKQSEVVTEIFAEINRILSDDTNDSDETMAYDEQAAAYYEAELCRIVEQIKKLEAKYKGGKDNGNE